LNGSIYLITGGSVLVSGGGLTGRAGLSLFVSYLHNIDIFPLIDRLFSTIRKSKKGLPVFEIFVDPDKLRLPINGTVCSACGLVQGERRGRCAYCGRKFLSNCIESVVLKECFWLDLCETCVRKSVFFITYNFIDNCI
jgi:hypothetical protein